MTTSTWVASGTVASEPVDAEATITINAGTLTVDLSSLEANPTAASQEVSGIEITFASAVSGPGTLTQTGSLISIADTPVKGTVTPVSGSPTRWNDSESGNTLTLTALGHGQPSDMIIGPPDGSGHYSNHNSSILNFLPSIQNTGTFDISSLSIPAGDTISGVKIVFGTGPDGRLTASAACFVDGTLIRTVSGDVAVEDLAIGDHVITASGEARRIRWLGYRAIACSRAASGNFGYSADPRQAWRPG